MKCGCLLLKRMTTGKKPKEKIILYISPYHRIMVGVPTSHINTGKDDAWPTFTEEELELCDGDIVAFNDSDNFGCGQSCCSIPKISYQCSKCRFPHDYESVFPTYMEDVAKYLTECIANIPEQARIEKLEQLKKSQQAAREKMEKTLKRKLH